MSRLYSYFKAPAKPSRFGFTLVELLVVIAVVALLVALLLPVLSKPTRQAQRAVCKSHLRQMGLGLHMYLSDTGRYPAEWGRNAQNFLAWADKAMELSQHSWTNAAWQCPTYVTRNGLVKIVDHPRGLEVFTSYAYNEWGMVDTARSQRLGLGLSSRSTAAETQIAAPSEMIAVADSRALSETRRGRTESSSRSMGLCKCSRSSSMPMRRHPSTGGDTTFFLATVTWYCSNERII